MAKVKKKCRICGKEYTPCGYCENDKMAFHYRTICCSRKCAEVYLMRVLEARGQIESVKISDSNADSSSKESINRTFNTGTNTLKLDNEPKNSIETDSEKPKRKYIKKKIVESENKEQVE